MKCAICGQEITYHYENRIVDPECDYQWSLNAKASQGSNEALEAVGRLVNWTTGTQNEWDTLANSAAIWDFVDDLMRHKETTAKRTWLTTQINALPPLI